MVFFYPVPVITASKLKLVKPLALDDTVSVNAAEVT